MIDNLEIIETKIEDKAILRNMLELYLYELSKFEKIDSDPHGQFKYPHFDSYWQEKGRHPFWAKLKGKLAGFVLVSDHHYTPKTDYVITEFFVMKRYRRQGIGQAMAFNVFDRFRGVWEIRVLLQNTEAILFWRKII